ncbi:MAG TPA: 3-carboxy-cis,cis-muconate cycloisomerase [Acidobacteriaceae bacterium]|nr:3-carboxy-cis,cis-muconate cycloisomerase [Acidobacteriaceae bacterium]
MNGGEPLPSLFSTEEMDGIFSFARQLQSMTRFEWGLNAALEANGLAAAASTRVLEGLLDAGFIEVRRLQEEAQQSGNLAIPFVRQLTGAVRARDPGAAAAIHLGATSQDLLDTALVLQMKDALTAVGRDLNRLEDGLLDQVRVHAETLLAGRTLLQDAPPLTLGLKLAGFVEALRRHRERIEAAAGRALVLQFGGAVGTLAALGDKGAAVSAEVARRLDLREPRLPWHTHRDNLVELATCLALLTGTLGKLARDISLLMQTEVGEVLEPGGEGRGGSSTMPHKRNPVASAIILAAAMRTPGLAATLLAAMVQEHERGLGGWHAEWETVPQLFRLAAVALTRSIEIVAGLDVRPDRMIANLEATGGLVMTEAISVALSARMGRERAHALLEEAVARPEKEHRHLSEILAETPEVRACLAEAELDRLFDPRTYLGRTREWISRVTGDTDADR